MASKDEVRDFAIFGPAEINLSRATFGRRWHDVGMRSVQQTTPRTGSRKLIRKWIAKPAHTEYQTYTTITHIIWYIIISVWQVVVTRLKLAITPWIKIVVVSRIGWMSWSNKSTVQELNVYRVFFYSSVVILWNTLFSWCWCLRRPERHVRPRVAGLSIVTLMRHWRFLSSTLVIISLFTTISTLTGPVVCGVDGRLHDAQEFAEWNSTTTQHRRRFGAWERNCFDRQID